MCVGTLGAHAGDGGVDQAGVGLGEIVVSKAEPLRDAGPVVLDQNVRGGGEPPGLLPSLVSLQVENDALLAPLPHGEARLAAQVVATWRLNLEHLGAVVAQEHRHQGAGQPPAQVDDGESFQWSDHTGLRFRPLGAGPAMALDAA